MLNRLRKRTKNKGEANEDIENQSAGAGEQSAGIDSENEALNEKLEKTRKKKKSKRKKNAEHLNSEDDMEEHDGLFSSDEASVENTENEPPRNSSPRKLGGFFDRFQKKKTEKKGNTESSQSLQGDSGDEQVSSEAQGGAPQKSKRKKSVQDLKRQAQSEQELYELLIQRGPGPWIEWSKAELQASPHARAHRLLHHALLFTALSGLLALEVLCFWQSSCSVEWWRPDAQSDPAIPVLASRALVPVVALLLGLVVPSGYAAEFSEVPQHLYTWTAGAAALATCCVVESGICFANAATATAQTARLWTAGEGMYLAKQFYKSQDNFSHSYYASHISYALLYIFIGSTTAIACACAVKLATQVKRSTSFPDSAESVDGDL